MKVCINNIVTEKIRKSIAIVMFYELALIAFIKTKPIQSEYTPTYYWNVRQKSCCRLSEST